MTTKKVLQLMNQYGLHFVHQREVSLFTFSVIYNTYVTGSLKKVLGFGYPAIVAVGQKMSAKTFLNEGYVARQLEALVNKDFNRVNDILLKAKQILNHYDQRLKKIKRKMREEPMEMFRFLAYHYYKPMISLGIFNSFYRYVGEREDYHKLTPKMIRLIAWGRQRVAVVYFEGEKLLKKAIDLVDDKFDFDTDLLRYMTWDEMKKFVKNLKVTKLDLKELAKRRRGYVLLIYDNQELIFSDKQRVRDILNHFTKEKNASASIIRGKTAFPGLIRNQVYNLHKNKKRVPAGHFVLVTNMTKPNDSLLIKKCSAIITDEGGILCHAAIIARELKIPCVIGTKIATKILKDGDLVEVDAERGIIKKIH